MHTLSTYDLVLNSIVVVVMPLIIWANLRRAGLQSPANIWLWRDHPNFMRSSILIIALLTAFAAMQLLGHFGLVSAAVVEIALPVIGVPFLAASLALIWFGAGAVRTMVRNWRAGHSGG
jgi:hypothetical protein